jgi:hypothetical protein
MKMKMILLFNELKFSSILSELNFFGFLTHPNATKGEDKPLIY